MVPHDYFSIATENYCYLSLFPTPIFRFNLSKDVNLCEVKQSIDNCFDDYMNNWNKYSDTNIITTNDKLHLDKNFSSLSKHINFSIEIVLKKLNIKNSGYTTLGMWANVHKDISNHVSHTHPNSFFSGVFYVNLPKNSGSIYFEDPRECKSMWDYDPDNNPTSVYQYRSWNITPFPGELIIFPSWLRHGTNSSFLDKNEYRISVSFNIMPKFTCSDITKKFIWDL